MDRWTFPTFYNGSVAGSVAGSYGSVDRPIGNIWPQNSAAVTRQQVDTKSRSGSDARSNMQTWSHNKKLDGATTVNRWTQKQKLNLTQKMMWRKINTAYGPENIPTRGPWPGEKSGTTHPPCPHSNVEVKNKSRALQEPPSLHFNVYLGMQSGIQTNSWG